MADASWSSPGAPRGSRVTRLVLASLLAFAAMALAACDEGGEITILDVEPRNGATQGEQPVKILGANFRTDIGYTVFFGNKPSTRVVIVDPSTLLAFTPSQEEAETVDIHIRADNGEAWVIHDVFEYQQSGVGPVQQLGEGPEKQEGGGLAY